LHPAQQIAARQLEMSRRTSDYIGQLHRVDQLHDGLLDRLLVPRLGRSNEQLISADVKIRTERRLPQEMSPRAPRRREIYALDVTGRDARH
jgi:hypothetical protein